MKRQKEPYNPYIIGRTLPDRARELPPVDYTSRRSGALQHAERPKRWRKVLLTIFLLILVPLLVLGAWDAYNLSRASRKLFGSGNLLAALAPAALHGESRGRVNILIVGYSADDPGHAGAKLTDSILVLSLSNQGKRSYMLSVPRDLYVFIPGYGSAKINEAFIRGENDEFSEAGYPPGGIGLLEKTVTSSLGIPVDYYAIVNYTAVREITDSLGGITVNIQSSDPRGIYDPNFQPQEGGPLRLSNGPQRLDGQTALRLTRARGAAGGYGLAQSDFDRTKNQQQVVKAIQAELSWQDLLNPLTNSRLLDAIAANVRTDVELQEAVPLFRLINSQPGDQLESVSLREINGRNLLSGYTTPSGQAALIPAAGLRDFSDIKDQIDTLNL